MPAFDRSRPGLHRIGTPLGDVLVDLSVPGRVTASAGTGPDDPPLRSGGRDLAVCLKLAHTPSGGFSLVAEDAPLAWDPADPAARLPGPDWKAAATCVLEAVESFIDLNPGIARVAGFAAIRARLSEIDETIGDAEDLLAQLRSERALLAERVGPLRRELISKVGNA
jgi:hypothetical protein